jgi:quercetin dioxygenase-like cupin family protein
MHVRALRIVAATAVTGLAVLGSAAATPPVEETFTLLAAGNVDQPVHVKAKAGEWKMRMATNAATSVVTAEVLHPPGSSSGWHKHPGPAIITVAQGTLTFYFDDDPACSPTRVHQGETVIEEGGDDSPAHYAVNEGETDVKLLVTLFATRGVFPRIDVPEEEAPANCPPREPS